MMGKWHILPMSNAAFAELLQLIFAGEIARQNGRPLPEKPNAGGPSDAQS